MAEGSVKFFLWATNKYQGEKFGFVRMLLLSQSIGMAAPVATGHPISHIITLQYVTNRVGWLKLIEAALTVDKIAVMEELRDNVHRIYNAQICQQTTYTMPYITRLRGGPHLTISHVL